jgi:hypothetical protein
MFHPARASTGAFDHHQIESVLVTRPAVPHHPDAGDSGNVPLLSGTDCLQSAPEGLRAASLHLHERHDPSLSDDEVHVVPAQLEAVGLDEPSAGREKCDGGTLTLETEYVPLILPFGYRGESPGDRHADTVVRPARRRKSGWCEAGREIAFPESSS